MGEACPRGRESPAHGKEANGGWERMDGADGTVCTATDELVEKHDTALGVLRTHGEGQKFRVLRAEGREVEG